MYIDNVKINALIDSGSTHCIIGPRLLNLVPRVKSRLRELQLPARATAVNGSEITYPAEVVLKVKIDEYEESVKAYYSPTLAYELVLGFNFLRSARFAVNFNDLRIQKPTIHVIIIPVWNQEVKR